MIYGSVDGLAIALATIVVGVLTLVGTVISARRSKAVSKELKPNGGSSAYDAINRRFDELGQQVAGVDRKVDIVVNELAHEKVRAQFAEAEASARLDRLEKP